MREIVPEQLQPTARITMGTTSVEIINQYFVGEKAWFTAESHSNMHQFAQELKFKDPADKSNTLVCGWHGKIKTPQYRIHFEWPRPQGQREN